MTMTKQTVTKGSHGIGSYIVTIIVEMDFINKLASPQRNNNIYASRKKLIDDDEALSEDNFEVVSKSNYGSYINKGMESIDSESTDYNTPTVMKKKSKSSLIELKERIKLPPNNSSSSDYKDKDVYKRTKKKSRRKTNSAKFLSKSNVGDHLTEETQAITALENYDKPESDKINTKQEIRTSDLNTSDSEIQTVEYEKPTRTISSSGDRNKNNSDKIHTSIEPENISKNNKQCDRKAEKIIALHVIKCDFLKNDWFIESLFVKIHIFNFETGKSISIIEDALVTKSFDFLKHGSLIAQWNEIIILNENLMEKTKNPIDLIIIFEIINKNIIGGEYQQKEEKSIAWAFIKPIGYEGCSNMNKKLKLQLYSINQHQDLFDLWKSKLWVEYPSAIYAKIKSVKLEETNEAINEIKFNFVQSASSVNRNPTLRTKQGYKDIKIAKRPAGQDSKIPNKILTKLNNVDGETTALKFDKSGSRLAASAKKGKKYIIIIYKVQEWEEETKLFFHKGIIYEICWNVSGNKLLTASADSTVCIWNLNSPKAYTKQHLMHSSFVYSAKFCNANENTVASGSYDKLIRIWENEDDKYGLSEELEGHKGYVNAICFIESVEIFFSGDSVGTIFKWAKGKDGWLRIMEIKNAEFYGKIINDLTLIPGGQRLLVVLRNAAPWTVNVANYSAETCYKDGLNNKFQTRGSVSSCGTLVLVGNNVWKASNGELHATYDPSAFDHRPILSVDYHPQSDTIVCSTGCRNSPILVVCRTMCEFRDPGLGLESYSKSFLSEPEEFNNQNYETTEKKTFKSVGERIKNDIGAKEKNHKNREFKLWNLLRKMDSILYNAKNRQNMNVNVNKYDGSPGEDKEKAITMEMTDFGEASEASNPPDTYTVENEIDPKGAVLDSNFARDVVHEIVESATSDVESLEEDPNV